jgi:ABC-type transport system substrate-binding protein
MACVFDNLIRRGPFDSGNIIPDPAHSREIAEDGKIYTFFLREGVEFNDGAELTAEDVKATCDRIARPPSGIGIPPSILFTSAARSMPGTSTASNSNCRRPVRSAS